MNCAVNNPAHSNDIKIKVNPLPLIDLGNDTSICSGDSITFDAGSDFANYLWQDQSTDKNLCAKTSGIYWLRATDNNGCSRIDSVALTVNPLPYINLGDEDYYCSGTAVNLDAGPGFESYKWQDGSSGRFYTAVDKGIYWVEVTDEDGCKNSDSASLISCALKLSVPNAFTPNGDGLNDVFKALTNSNDISEFRMLIYNRWGQQLFESDDVNRGWDGTYKAEPCPEGVYIWIISYKQAGNLKAEQKTPFNGQVTLIR